MNIKVVVVNSAQMLEQAMKIRTAVFVEEQGVEKELEFDGLDHLATSYLLLLDNVPVGTTRVRKTKEGCKIERFAVLKNYRIQGLGKTLLHDVMNKTLPLGERIYLNAQEQVVEFYKKNGFQVCSDRFVEANIPHFQMVSVESLIRG
ncbi:MAG: GNAT family N-acetyltransferase [Bacteroidia bacterium]|nr:GNAT family N-acetyltransferase [Bacteroidia bacterium]